MPKSNSAKAPEHTPTPWRADRGDSVTIRSGKEAVAYVDDAIYRNRQMTRANRAFIVQCVNAHSELVAALQKAIDRLKFDLDLDYGTAKQGQGALPRPLLLEELQAALKKAGAE